MLHTTKSYNNISRRRRIIVRDRLHTAAHNYTLPHTATHSYTLPHTAAHSCTQLHTATHSHTLPHTATHSHTQMGYRQPHCRIIN